MHRWFAVIFVGLVVTGASAQPAAPKVFEESDLGFRYNPPQDLRDLTLFDREQMQKQLKAMKQYMAGMN